MIPGRQLDVTAVEAVPRERVPEHLLPRLHHLILDPGHLEAMTSVMESVTHSPLFESDSPDHQAKSAHDPAVVPCGRVESDHVTLHCPSYLPAVALDLDPWLQPAGSDSSG